MQKDLKLSLNMGDQLEQPLPLTASANEVGQPFARGFGLVLSFNDFVVVIMVIALVSVVVVLDVCFVVDVLVATVVFPIVV